MTKRSDERGPLLVIRDGAPTVVLLGLGGLLSVVTGYLLVLLAAAKVGRHRPPAIRTAADRLRFVVLVPAHNEERSIGKTVATLQNLDYPKDRYQVIIIADNCQDHTADVARAAGASVYERTEPARRGKGQALAWALERLRTERPEVDAFAFIDADCQASPNLLTAMEGRIRAGAVAVQTSNMVGNPGESWASSLRFAAFALFTLVRPRGKEALGLSTGLFGTGFALTRQVLERHPWEAFSLSEDHEYHMRLVEAGERAVLAPEASVSSWMPTSLRESEGQHMRWEGGRWQMVRTWSWRLIVAGIRQRDAVRLHAGLEPLVPPQSLSLAGAIGLLMLALGLRSRVGIKLAIANLLGQACYVVGGLLLIRAPRVVYRALAMAPILMMWKVGIYMRLLARRGAQTWTRAGREPAARQLGER